MSKPPYSKGSAQPSICCYVVGDMKGQESFCCRGEVIAEERSLQRLSSLRKGPGREIIGETVVAVAVADLYAGGLRPTNRKYLRLDDRLTTDFPRATACDWPWLHSTNPNYIRFRFNQDNFWVSIQQTQTADSNILSSSIPIRNPFQ